MDTTWLQEQWSWLLEDPSGQRIGLGLALVAKIVGDHGGVVEFESQARRTMFRLLLPVAPAEARPA